MLLVKNKGDTMKREAQLTTLGDRVQTQILASSYISNALLFYLAALWTVRLFQPLKVFN